jgi:hypothetical protein
LGSLQIRSTNISLKLREATNSAFLYASGLQTLNTCVILVTKFEFSLNCCEAILYISGATWHKCSWKKKAGFKFEGEKNIYPHSLKINYF